MAQVFISHMVQIILLHMKHYCLLKLHFISHMVQIIPVITKALSSTANAFISHMVQIIHLLDKLHNFLVTTFFISHMVQIILSKRALNMGNIIILYIPHGSDNTYEGIQVNKKARIFISHMVQIILK